MLVEERRVRAGKLFSRDKTEGIEGWTEGMCFNTVVPEGPLGIMQEGGDVIRAALHEGS